ncbi:hypothetical protein [Humitalea rosea]|uniref:hypothetical protein n=1 Tax=Humitalea rosea TaxID=990373 RepID=UPI001313D9EA|nr:hypothetical protein [Humitalea rosea]
MASSAASVPGATRSSAPASLISILGPGRADGAAGSDMALGPAGTIATKAGSACAT